MSYKKDYDVTYKVLVLGESTVGKTALIRYHCEKDREFNPNLVPTIGRIYNCIHKVIIISCCDSYALQFDQFAILWMLRICLMSQII